MQSKFTAMALALAFVTVTALPAMAFTLSEEPVGGEEVGAVPPNGALVGAVPPNGALVGAVPPNGALVGAVPPNGALVGAVPPNGALPAPGADHQLLDLQMGVVAAPGAPQAAGSTHRWELFFDGSAIESSTGPASPGGTKGLSPPENSPVAVFPSRNQPAPQAIIPSAAVVEQKVRLPAMAGPGGGPHIAQSAKPAEFAPRN